MKNKLRNIHRRISKCNKCEEILNNLVLPRSGFPPRDIYKALIIGAEPGPKTKGLLTSTEYEIGVRLVTNLVL
jgi:uracil-DNA glycosylase